MFYLTMHLNLFYLQLCCIEHMVKDHSDSKRDNLLLPQQGIFYMHHPIDKIATAFVSPVGPP